MIAVVNFGSQFTHLIARRLRALNVHAEVLAPSVTPTELKKLKPSGLILSGGPSSVDDAAAPTINPGLLKLGVPVLGICYGQQLLTALLGGAVEPDGSGQYGREALTVTGDSPLWKGTPSEQTVWFSHGDSVAKLPEGFEAVGSTRMCPNAAIADRARNFYGLQFHPEVVHTEYGNRILKNFAKDVCRDPLDWTIERAKDVIIGELDREIAAGPGGGILLGVSGGVDSSVAAALLHERYPDRLFCVFIDHGLLRKGDAEEVAGIFAARGLRDFRTVDASRKFLSRLKGVTDPEEKRKIIGHTFIEVFEAEAKKIGKTVPVKYLAQGTIYPDRIESAQPSQHAAKIKSHHNLTLPEKLDLTIIEPLKELYKDEVRELGRTLGLPERLIGRHPFPGPGLAIRILGEVTAERVAMLQAADAIYLEELHRAGLYDDIWQAFAALLPVKSVGVMGDARTYADMVSLRAVTSVDGMTADWFAFPPDVLARISTRIVNEVPGVNRVVYDVTQKPPGTIEYE